MIDTPRDTPRGSNFNTAAEDHFHQKIPRHSGIAVSLR